MIVITTEEVRRSIAAIGAVTEFNERIRAHILEDPDLSAAAAAAGAAHYVEARNHVANALEWKIYSHCASVTRLYALYESFVYKLLSEWLTAVPTLYTSYAELPNSILRNHRSGIGNLLQKYGGPRTEKFTELSLVEPLFLALSGNPTYGLIPDAFYIDLQNLREEELCNLFSRVSLNPLNAWLHNHSELKAMCEVVGTTVGSKLKDLVDFRNEAAHNGNEIEEVLGATAFQQLADFISLLCDALYEFVLSRYFEALEANGLLESIGEITEYFGIPDAGIITMRPTSLRVGDVVIARGTQTCFATHVMELQDNDVSVDQVAALEGQEIGARFSRTTRKGLKLFREIVRDRSTDSQAAIPA